MPDKEIVKIEDYIDYKHILILASDARKIKQIIQKTTLKHISKGRYELVNVIEVLHLGKLVASTAHLSLAIVVYNKI